MLWRWLEKRPPFLSLPKLPACLIFNPSVGARHFHCNLESNSARFLVIGNWDCDFFPLNQMQFRVKIAKCLLLRKRATQIFEALDVRHHGWLEASNPATVSPECSESSSIPLSAPTSH